MDSDSLLHDFSSGKTPPSLEGFYGGNLLLLLPHSPSEYLAQLLSHFFVPWKGKFFSGSKQTGDNILPLATKPFLKLYPRTIPTGTAAFGGYHAFPFTTKVTKSLQGVQDVLRLTYDLPENPLPIRRITDELVMTEKNQFLGKVFLAEKNDSRLLGFFKLQK